MYSGTHSNPNTKGSNFIYQQFFDMPTFMWILCNMLTMWVWNVIQIITIFVIVKSIRHFSEWGVTQNLELFLVFFDKHRQNEFCSARVPQIKQTFKILTNPMESHMPHRLAGFTELNPFSRESAAFFINASPTCFVKNRRRRRVWR